MSNNVKSLLMLDSQSCILEIWIFTEEVIYVQIYTEHSWMRSVVCGIFSAADHQEEEDVSGGRHLLTAACGHLDLQHLHSEVDLASYVPTEWCIICNGFCGCSQDVDVLLGRSDVDVDTRVSIREFRKVLCSSTPVSRSTPLRPADLLRAQHWVRLELQNI